ncbi:MAG: hypothetical protein U9Q83_00970 [Bacteroidota bacterium]|nr:hypothetical protein [Bacteroidota bacterium]
MGFICEGYTEKEIIDSRVFKQFLKKLNINFIQALNSKGNGKLLPEKIEKYNSRLKQMGAWQILIITDSDKDTIKEVYDRIKPDEKLHILIISVKKVESWFLSNDETLKSITGITYSEYRTKTKNKLPVNVEELGNPYDQLEDIFNEKTELLDTSKFGIAKEFIKNQFDVQNSNCDSAKYFVNKLKEVAKYKPVTIKKTSKSKKRKKKSK